MITLVAFLCALAALVIAILNGMGRGRPPLWIAVALLAFGAMLPWVMSRLIF
jgi:O-antigen/teichoic acid export membrane protein